MVLSIIIPAYNEEKYLAKTLESINLGETIVVCNGCTDNTIEVARRLAHKVVILPKKGVARARNAGAKEASYNRLVFLDADIKVDSKVLHEIAATKYSIGTSWVKPDTNKIFDNLVMFFKSYIHHLGTCTGLIFCDKSRFEAIGGFNESLKKKEDGNFLRRGKKLGNYGIVKAYVFNNMRRFRQLGYAKIVLYWLREYTFPTNRDYQSIR